MCFKGVAVDKICGSGHDFLFFILSRKTGVSILQPSQEFLQNGFRAELLSFPSQGCYSFFFPHSKISQLLQDPPVKGGNTLFAHKLSPLIPHVLTLVQLEKAEKNKTKPTPNAPQK